MTLDEAFGGLGLPRSATPTEIKARWRVLVRQCHPDTSAYPGKDYARLDQAYRRALAHAKLCPTCKGVEYKVFTIVLQCPTCNGTGVRK